jgi:hypothetical protein
MSSSFAPSNVRLGSACISTFLCMGAIVGKTDRNEQQAMRFTRTGESHHTYFTGSRPRWFRAIKKLRGVCHRLSLASQLMALSDNSLEQVWLVPLLLALKSRLPTNTTASFSATAALARAYVILHLSFIVSPC